MKYPFLKHLIKKYDVISFDIFDTLIERNVKKPCEIFCLVGENILGKDYADSFMKERINAESKARTKCKNGEAKLEDIYDVLKKTYGDTTQSLMNNEIETEIVSCRPHKTMISYFEYAKILDKKVFLISDMYLSKYVIEQMLQKCNISGYDNVYISNEAGCNKITRQLFEYIIDKENLQAKDIIHIGDSFKADYMGPRKVGIKSYWLACDCINRKINESSRN